MLIKVMIWDEGEISGGKGLRLSWGFCEGDC